MMVQKYLKRGREVKGNTMVIISTDGALHSFTDTKDYGIVLYSTQLYHPDYINDGVSSTSSNDKSTWMNSLTNETMEIIYPLIIPIFEQQALLRSHTIR